MSDRAEQVRAGFREFAERDIDALLAAMTPDVEVRIAPAALAGKPELMRRSRYHGRAGVREWLAEIDEDYSEFSLEVRSVEDSGDAVLVLGTLAYECGAGGGGMTIAWLCRMEGDLVAEMDILWDWEQARAACRALAA